MKIQKGMQIKVDIKTEEEFKEYVAGQGSVKEATLLHSITFDPKEKKATIIYLFHPGDEINSEYISSIHHSCRLVDVYVA